jgi:electron transfer flavoprotein alpha subunit
VCTRGGASGEEPAELLTLGRACGEVTWLCLGELPADAIEIGSRYGVASIHQIDHPAVISGGPDSIVESLTQYCESVNLSLLLFSQTFDARLLAPRLAGRLNGAVVMNALSVEVDGDETRVTASAYGGDAHAINRMTGDGPHIVAVMPNAVGAQPAAEPSSPGVKAFDVDLSTITERIRVISPAKAEGARLEDAQVIVAGGRGLGSPSNFHLIEELAEAFGGMPAASRPLVDDGWTEATRQVGLTGRITRPALYMALGISGASQHMAGCSAAKTIVAVNRDPDAAIFRYAKYGIVGDCLEIIPELIRAVREA